MSRFLSPVLLILAALVAGAAPAAAQAAALLQAAALSGDASGLTLTLGLSAPVQPVVFVLNAPRRVVVDLPGTRCAAALRLPPAAGLVTALRGAAPEHGSYRLGLGLRGQPDGPARGAAGTGILTGTGIVTATATGTGSSSSRARRGAGACAERHGARHHRGYRCGARWRGSRRFGPGRHA